MKSNKPGTTGRGRRNMPEASVKPLPRAILRGALTALLLSVILSLPLALILYKCGDPSRFLSPVAHSVLLICCLLGGYSAGISCKRSALLCGIGSGAFFIGISLLLSLVLENVRMAELSTVGSLTLRGICLLLFLIGSVIGVNRTGKKKSKH